MIITPLEVARFYYGNRSEFGRDRWRISAETAMAVARQVPWSDGMSDEVLEHMVRLPGVVLCGQPIIIDDSVSGLMLEPMQ